MNVNLMSLTAEIDESYRIVSRTQPIGDQAVLLPDPEVRGVYQVWWPTTDNQWLHVTPDGQIIRQDFIEAIHYVGEETN